MSDRAYQDPPDELVATWLTRYGSTGVKSADLEDGANAGAVAWYRELSVTERLILARLDSIAEDVPDAYDVQKMIVSTALLWPAIDDYPFPALAVAEIFTYVRQHGHGPLDTSELEEEIPSHMVRDIRIARENAQVLLTDQRYQTVYFNICIRLASRGGSPDPKLLYWLMQQPPGVLRDIMSLVELAHGTLLESSLRTLHKDASKDVDKKAEEQRMRALFFSPFDVLDEAAQGRTMPFSDAQPSEAPEEASPVIADDKDLLPNAPISSKADIERLFN